MTETLCAVAESDTARLEIHIDSDPQDPRKAFDNLTTMVCWHRRHSLGDHNKYNSPREWAQEMVNEWAGLDWDRIEAKTDEQLYQILEKHAIIQPLYLYDHSGITISTSSFSDPWDSGQVGWVYVTKEKARKEFGVKRLTKQLDKKLRNAIGYEVKEYDEYLTGQVFGYVFQIGDEQQGSCSGFYGREHLLSELKYALPEEHQHLIEQIH